MTGSSDLRCRIDGYCIRSVSEDDDNFEIVAAYDGVESSLSIGDVDRDEAVEVALCGLRLDYVRREIGLGTATAADVRTAIEDAAVLGHGDDDISDLIEAFMLLASEDELDAWREEKVRRLMEEMDEDEIVEVWSTQTPSLNGTTMVISVRSEKSDTITLSRDQLTSALREAAAFGTDLSSCSSTTAGAVREVADLVLEAVVSGRAIGDEYDTLLDAEKRIAR